MPELPEVESIRLGLKKVLVGQNVLEVNVNEGKIVSSNSNIRVSNDKKITEFKSNIKNKSIISVERRAKNIIIKLNDLSVILIHLKMTGQLVYEDSKKNKIIGGHPIINSYTDNLPNKHTHIIFELDNGSLYYNDTRKFGYVLYYKSVEKAIEANHFKKIGPEPLEKDFTLKDFREGLLSKNKNLKQVLLEQEIVVGIGNIYADEICFASGLLPSKICNTLTSGEIESLYNNIKSILRLAIKHGGSSISDYLLADGSRGNYARLHAVYGRAGKPCKVCGNVLEKSKMAGRTTVFCPFCQK
ncbi:MAG: Formamidopyrimidine-DNA glycosylase [Patescibacteria group bacterium]|nr:Formamidopyrimidine-DNA glycosylase [Patescibacteria group bacterium]